MKIFEWGSVINTISHLFLFGKPTDNSYRRAYALTTKTPFLARGGVFVFDILMKSEICLDCRLWQVKSGFEVTDFFPIISINLHQLIFGFLSWYPKFWFGKITADFNPIYKIPKLHIASAHLTNFKSLQILHEGTKSNKNIGWKKCIFAIANLQTHYHDRSSVFLRVSDHNLALSRSTCDITLIHVLSTGLNIW